jgi:hypothetical protein
MQQLVTITLYLTAVDHFPLPLAFMLIGFGFGFNIIAHRTAPKTALFLVTLCVPLGIAKLAAEWD